MTDTLKIFAAEPVRTGRATDAVLASLPLSYAPAADGTRSDVAVVEGTGHWPAAVVEALQRGAAGIIVVQPGPAGVDELRALDAGHGLVIVDSPWASNPVVNAASQELRAALGPRSRLECRIVVGVGTDLDRSLLDQLSLVRVLVGPASDLAILYRSEHGYVGEARAGGIAVDLSVVCTNAVQKHARVRLLTGDGSVDLDIPSGETARPARLTVTGPHGAVLAPTLYESGHRSTWRRLHRLISNGEPADDLDGLEADIATVAKHQYDQN